MKNHQPEKIRKLLLITLFATGLSACGGGSGGSTGNTTSINPGASGGGTSLSSNGSGNKPAPTTPPAPVSPPASSGIHTITFMHYNDLHAHLNPHPDRVSDGHGGSKIEIRGGVARAATLIQRIRQENPDSVLMNIGDTYHGGAEAWFTLGNAIVPPVNALGIDVGVPGNWDFGYSATVFRLRYTDAPFADIMAVADRLRPKFNKIMRPNFPNLAANMTYKSNGELVSPATLMKDV